MTRDEISTKAQKIVAEHLKVDTAKVVANAHFADLGADSLDHVEIIMAFEEAFDIEISDDEGLTMATFGQAVDLLDRRLS